MHYYALFVNKIPVGVLGASGYAGRELCALVLRHPRLSLAFATANEQRGATVAPRRPRRDVRRARRRAARATPSWCSARCRTARRRSGSARVQAAGARVVDLSADLRPGNGCEGIAYGLTELNRALIAGANVVANPGLLSDVDPPRARAAVRARPRRAGRDDRRELGERRHRRGQFAEARAAVRRGRRGLPRVRRRQHAPPSQRDARDARRHGARTRISSSRRTCCRSRAAFCRRSRFRSRRRSTIRSRRGATRTPTSRSSRSRASTPSLRDVVHRNVVRISATPLAGHAHADAARHVGDRQPHEGRRGPGAAEREPDARSRRDRGVAGMTRVIKVGGRPQTRSRAPGDARGGCDRATAGGVVRRARRRRRSHGAAAALGGSRRSSTGAA